MRRRSLALAAILAAVLSACAEFSPGIALCAIDADNPHESSLEPGMIKGSARMGCDTSGVVLSGYIDVQMKVGPSWVTFVRTPFPSFTVAAEVEYTRSAKRACVTGTISFRTKGHAYATYLGSAASADDYSQVVSNPC